MSERIEALLKAQLNTLSQILQQLQQIARNNAPISPNYRRRLAEYSAFDWSSIDALVITRDTTGATEVEWNAHRFTRRSGAGKFGEAIWFSRPISRSDDTTNYARLITFKDGEAEPLAVQVPSSPKPTKNNGQTKTITLPAPPTLNPQPSHTEEDDASPTTYWTFAAALMSANRCTHPDAGAIAKGNGSWAEKAARLLDKYGPLPSA